MSYKLFLTLSLGALILMLATSCTEPKLKQGPWLGSILPDSTQPTMPVNFQMDFLKDSVGNFVIDIRNANEKIRATEIRETTDSLIIYMPVFSSVICAAKRGDSLIGKYYPKGKTDKRVYRFYAHAGVTDRYPHDTLKPIANLTGRWKFIENPGGEDQSIDVAEFMQDGSKLTGTILTTTGDYRFLEGKVSGSTLWLSCFDGAHSMVFKAEITPDERLINGQLIGSPAWKVPFEAERNDTIQLPPADKLVWLKEGVNTLHFSLPDLTGKLHSPQDERFKDKVLIIQVLGSWCPNCMDETRMYVDFYKKYQSKGLEIIALSFETKDFEPSAKRIKRFMEHTGANYTFLWAGEASRDNRSAILQGVEGQMAYPTTLFMDKKGQIRKVETGFSGPGTGAYYDKLSLETETFIQQLLAE
jgi:peroxiredoxin